MPKKRVYDTYVPPVGPKHTDIMCVGEAPGKQEEKDGEPFVGWSGSLMTDYFRNDCGLSREDIYLTNLARYRPYKNQFKWLLDTPQLEEGLRELSEEIEQVDPTVIVAFGAWPMYFLTGKTNDKGEPGTGILNWRGSVVPSTMAPGKKVVCSVHPAFLARNFKWHPIFKHDLQLATAEGGFPEIRYPDYEVLVDPPDAEDVIKEMLEAEFITFDIENFRDRTISCIGFADSPKRAVVFTFQNPAWDEYAQILLDAPVPKVPHFGAYDINFLWRFYKLKTRNYWFDTYVAAATLTPEFPKGLDFLTSIYTRFPYYKEERKTWKENQDLNQLWEYNAKDVIATYTIALEQMKDLKEDFEWTGQQLVPELPSLEVA